MKKRFLGLIFAGVLSISLLAGCGKKDTGADNAGAAAADETETAAAESEDKDKNSSEDKNKDNRQKEDGKDKEVKKEEPKEDSEEEKEEDKSENEVAESEFFSQFADWTFHFTSGAGAWETYLNIAGDGSFKGEYYDADMGDTGEGYEEGGTMYICKFEGKFEEPDKVEDHSCELKIKDMTYDEKEEREEIKDGVRYVYSMAAGINDAKSLILYLPGAETDKLSEEAMSWLTPTHFSCYLQDEFYQAIPDRLPFYVLYNKEQESAFFSEYEGKDNKFFLSAKGYYPGITNRRHEINEDGTYLFEDANDGYTFAIVNACIPNEKDMSIYSMDSEEFAKKVIEKVIGGDINDFYCLDNKNFFYGRPAMVSTDGYNSIYAGWQSGGNEDTRSYTAKITQIGDYNYIYACVRSEYDELVDGEAIGFLLESLTVSGLQDHLSTAYPDGRASENIKKIYAIVKNGDNNSVQADEVKWISLGDEDLMQQYGLTTEDMLDDYAIVDADGDYHTYTYGKDCSLFIQYPEDLFKKYQKQEEFNKWLKEHEERLMIMFVNDSDEIRFMYEPYTP